jgi:hypothetical protein
MLLTGAALIGSLTLDFSIYGEAGNWKLTVKARNNLLIELETFDHSPFALLQEMLDDALAACYVAFPERRPPPKPKPRPKPVLPPPKRKAFNRRAAR